MIEVDASVIIVESMEEYRKLPSKKEHDTDIIILHNSSETKVLKNRHGSTWTASQKKASIALPSLASGLSWIPQQYFIPDPFMGEITLNVDGDKAPVCECGGDKIRTGHSSWCPKASKK